MKHCLILGIVAALLVSCGGTAAVPTPAPVDAIAQQPRHVTYSVTGTANDANVTYIGPKGQRTEFLDVRLPWSVEFDAPPSQRLFLSARNPHTPTTVTCTVLVDGKVWKTKSYTGDNTMAVCDDE